MPEGDTIHRAAAALRRALAGKAVTGFESAYPSVTRVAIDHPVVGRTIDAVDARGKHLLMTFSGDLVLHTHLRMNGSWHLYPAGARWQRAARDMRVLVATADAVAVGFNVPVVELLTTRALARHEQLRALGPDPLAPGYDRADVLRRAAAHAGEAIGDVLLNQRVIAGVGNVLKSEVLFIAGIDPFRTVGAIGAAALERIVDVAREQLQANTMDASRTLARTAGRRTTRSMDPDAKLFVYGRGGRPCRRCGTAIQSRKTGADARVTYWCPVCQR